MKKIITLSLCLFAFLSIHTPSGAKPAPAPPAPASPTTSPATASGTTSPATVATTATSYPYSEIGKIYDTVLNAMMPNFLESIETDGKSYAKDIKLFIDKTMPKSRFVSEMTSDADTKRIFDKAKTDTKYRKTKEFQDRFSVAVTVSVKMGMIIFAGRFDVFNRKYVDPTEISKKLFLMTDDEDYEDYISWVSGEVSQEEVKKKLAEKIEILPDDIFYAFDSPEWYWKQLAGRRGYLQVRGDKIINAHITMLN